jgi:hypothetical protein
MVPALAPDAVVFMHGARGKMQHISPMVNGQTTMPWRDLKHMLTYVVVNKCYDTYANMCYISSIYYVSLACMWGLIPNHREPDCNTTCARSGR